MASTFSVVRAVRVVMCAGACWCLAFRPRHRRRPRRQLRQPAQAQEVREELDKLRKEFEAVRDAYGARLAALEAKLSGDGRAAAAPAGRRPAAAAAGAAAAPHRQFRCRRARRAAAGRRARCRSMATPSAMSKIFNPDIAVIGNFVGAAGKNAVNPTPGVRAGRGRSDVPGGCRSVRARRLLSRVLARGRRDRGGLPDVDVAARRPAGQGRQAQAAGRQGEHAARACPALGRPAADGAEPVRRRRRPGGLRRVGLEADPQSVDVPRGDRRGLPGHVGRVPVVRTRAT